MIPAESAPAGAFLDVITSGANERNRTMSDNSKATLRSTISDLVTDYEEYQKLCNDDESGSAYDEYEKAESICERLRELPLSCEVRSGWEAHSSKFTALEFRIMLGTGGPAYWIAGDLDQHDEPTGVKAFHQDWYEPEQVIYLNEKEQEAVDWFAGLFYWGQ